MLTLVPYLYECYHPLLYTKLLLAALSHKWMPSLQSSLVRYSVRGAMFTTWCV